jgi:putative transposase
MNRIRYNPFDFSHDLQTYKRKLPHWRQDGCAYFVTFRLGDSIPKHQLREWKVVRDAWIEHHPLPWTEDVRNEYDETFTAKMEEYLHSGYGSCALRNPRLAKIIADAIEHFDGTRYAAGDFVVMPNHVHAIVLPFNEHGLDQILHSWKSYSSTMINRATGNKRALWSPESYDRIIRNEKEMVRIAQYIQANPIKAGLPENQFILGGTTENWEQTVLPVKI